MSGMTIEQADFEQTLARKMAELFIQLAKFETMVLTANAANAMLTDRLGAAEARIADLEAALDEAQAELAERKQAMADTIGVHDHNGADPAAATEPNGSAEAIAARLAEHQRDAESPAWLEPTQQFSAVKLPETADEADAPR